MAVILIFLSFILSFLFFIEIRYNENYSQGFNKREAFIKSSLLISFLSYLFCEIYSLFNILNYFSLLISWGLVFGVLAFIILKKNIKLSLFRNKVFNPCIEIKYKIILVVKSGK